MISNNTFAGYCGTLVTYMLLQIYTFAQYSKSDNASHVRRIEIKNNNINGGGIFGNSDRGVNTGIDFYPHSIELEDFSDQR